MSGPWVKMRVFVTDPQSADLSAAVDVYSDWVDACDAVAKEADDEPGGGSYAPSRASKRPSAGRARDEEEEDDDDIIDDTGYGGEGIVNDDDEY